MFRLKLVPDNTKIGFIGKRRIAYVLSGLAVIASITLFAIHGLNYGIDFRGGIMLEIATREPADLGAMRATLGKLKLGDVAIQEFGSPNDVLIRIERQPGDATAQNAAAKKVQTILSGELGDGVHYRRIEFVGPKVSSELIEKGILSVVLAVLAVLVYIWFRFEWQFGVGAVVALVHDVTLTIGFFSVTGLEFNLSIVAAILTIVGYSLNDTVVVYDRVRENLRKFKKMPLPELLDLSMNETLSRTIMTSLTTVLALLALLIFGGEVIRGFTAAMIWGIFVGTYSSIYIASPLLLFLKIERGGDGAPVAKTVAKTEKA
jgi:preprotein translocase SecF subunit